MILGILQVELSIPDPQSIKDKRRIVKSLKDRLHREHQVSVAEIDAQDDPGTAMLGIALVASSVDYCQSVLDRILDKVRLHRDCVLADHNRQILTGS